MSKPFLRISFAASFCLICSFVSAGFCESKLYADASLYERIISLSPAVTKVIHTLGLWDRIVGVTTYCTNPLSAKKKEVIGTIMETNIEKIIELRPDLVIGTELTSSRDIKKLKNLGINIITFNISKNFDGLCQAFLSIASLLGKDQEAHCMLEKTKKEVEKTKKEVENRLPVIKVFVQLGSKPLFSATKNHLINDLIEFSGGINIFKNAGSGVVSREEVLMRNPDVIIIATMGIEGEKEQKSWFNYSTVSAVKNKNIHLIDSNSICSPTPIGFAELLKDISKILHPEISNLKDVR